MDSGIYIASVYVLFNCEFFIHTRRFFTMPISPLYILMYKGFFVNGTRLSFLLARVNQQRGEIFYAQAQFEVTFIRNDRHVK